jgi:hypothetical protein
MDHYLRLLQDVLGLGQPLDGFQFMSCEVGTLTVCWAISLDGFCQVLDLLDVVLLDQPPEALEKLHITDQGRLGAEDLLEEVCVHVFSCEFSLNGHPLT